MIGYDEIAAYDRHYNVVANRRGTDAREAIDAFLKAYATAGFDVVGDRIMATRREIEEAYHKVMKK